MGVSETDLASALNWASIDAMAGEPDYALASRIIDAPSLSDYRKPRTVTTAAELNALAYGAVLLTSDYTDAALLKDRDVFRNQSGGEVTAEMLISYGTQPFTVLHEPTP